MSNEMWRYSPARVLTYFFLWIGSILGLLAILANGEKLTKLSEVVGYGIGAVALLVLVTTLGLFSEIAHLLCDLFRLPHRLAGSFLELKLFSLVAAFNIWSFGNSLLHGGKLDKMMLVVFALAVFFSGCAIAAAMKILSEARIVRASESHEEPPVS